MLFFVVVQYNGGEWEFFYDFASSKWIKAAIQIKYEAEAIKVLSVR